MGSEFYPHWVVGRRLRAVSDVVLWHIAVSHYNEKARWALAHKGVEHERRAPGPPLHMPVALALTRGRHATFPILRLDGEIIGDSTAIIAALEAKFPHRPLYPEDDAERRRALDLEDFFDEQVGPAVRLLAWHHLTQDRERLEAFTATEAPKPHAARASPWRSGRAPVRQPALPGWVGRRRGPGRRSGAGRV